MNIEKVSTKLAHAILGPPVCPNCRKKLIDFWYLGIGGQVHIRWTGTQYKFVALWEWEHSSKAKFDKDHDFYCGVKCRFNDETIMFLVRDLIPEEAFGLEENAE